MRGAAAFFTTAVVLFFASPLFALEQSSKRECAICHVMWMDEFKGNEETLIPWVNTNVLMKSSYGVVSTEEMCYSCHDGFVVDSRAAWTAKRHTVYKKPSGKIKIDEKRFPLSVKGEIYCGTCHTIHAGTSEEIVSYKVFLRMDNLNSEMCRACHTGYGSGPSKGFHTTMKEVKAGFPAGLKEAGLRPAANLKDVICDSCHKVHGAERDDLVPATGGISDFCGECHKDANVKKAGEGKLLAHRMGKELKDIKPSEELKKEGAKFENNRLGCLSCHKVHKGKTTRDILVMDDRDSELCLQCHDSMKGIKETPHNLRITGKDVRTAKDNRTVEEAGACGICHGSHGWAQPLAEGRTGAAEVCDVCHGIGRKVTKAEVKGPYSHSVGKDLEKVAKGVNTGLPLFGPDLSEGDKLYCPTCHEPHRAGEKEKVKDERGLLKTKFLRKESKTVLCETCHAAQKYVRLTDHDGSLFEKKYENVKKEKPAEAGLCGTCHLVHEGPKPIGFAAALPAGEYPAEIKRNEGNLYCLACHEEGRSGDKKLTGRISHPLGNKPKEAEGKIKDEEVTCASCHDPHRWSPAAPAFGPGKNVDGDLTNSFLRTDNSRGALCGECHKTAYKVVRTKHDVSEKEKKGVCEFCHATHNAKEKNLWARDLSKAFPEEKMKSRPCLECHTKGAPGEKAVVKLYRHPDKFLLANPLLLMKAHVEPDMKGLEVEVQCLSCHDPHVWSRVLTEGKAYGTVSSKTAFLRAEDPAKTFCVDCHRNETRYKYQFFHNKKARTEDNPYYDPSRLIESMKKIKKKLREE